MQDDASVLVRFKGLDNDDDLRELLEKRCRDLSREFPELTRVELTLLPAAAEFAAQAHAAGKGTDSVAHAESSDLRQAGERALDKLERELRREHDKRIFAHRREAQRSARKRTS